VQRLKQPSASDLFSRRTAWTLNSFFPLDKCGIVEYTIICPLVTPSELISKILLRNCVELGAINDIYRYIRSFQRLRIE
jgi:hypothetical protein